MAVRGLCNGRSCAHKGRPTARIHEETVAEKGLSTSAVARAAVGAQRAWVGLRAPLDRARADEGLKFSGAPRKRRTRSVLR